jgi:probable rRNA maturation factor
MFGRRVLSDSPCLPKKNLITFQKRVAGLSEATLRGFLLRARRAVGLSGTVNLLLTTSAAMLSLNRKFRGQDAPTDVLSFPSAVFPAAKSARIAGDVAISVDIAATNAGRLRHSTAEEVKILVLHGILHLAGFDHERDNGEMARKEAKLRKTLGLPVALIERSKPERNKPGPTEFVPPTFSPKRKSLRKMNRPGTRRSA